MQDAYNDKYLHYTLYLVQNCSFLLRNIKNATKESKDFGGVQNLKTSGHGAGKYATHFWINTFRLLSNRTVVLLLIFYHTKKMANEKLLKRV